jgi:hypothetical protein
MGVTGENRREKGQGKSLKALVLRLRRGFCNSLGCTRPAYSPSVDASSPSTDRLRRENEAHLAERSSKLQRVSRRQGFVCGTVSTGGHVSRRNSAGV